MERFGQYRQQIYKEEIMMNTSAINPGNMARPRGYSHAIAVSGDRRTIYIGGQNAVDERGNTVGMDLADQSRQVLLNIEKILDASRSFAGIPRLPGKMGKDPDPAGRDGCLRLGTWKARLAYRN
jgi:hypothetical protein